MTSRSGVKRAGLASPQVSTTSTQLSSSLQQLTSESEISASCIALSPGFIVHFAVFAALHASQSHLDIDLARRKVYESSSGKALEDSLLTHSQITKDEATLWVFCVDQCSPGTDRTFSSSRLHDLELHGLTRSVQDQFSFAELYPCCTICSTRRIPCPTCLQSSSGSEPSSQTRTPSGSTQSDSREIILPPSPFPGRNRPSTHLSGARHLPRRPLRQPLAFFLNAVQERIINDICENAQSSGNVARRLRTGILWGLPSSSCNWGDGWEQHGKNRFLSFSHIEVTLFASGIFIQPQLRPTQFLPFLPTLPLPPGTPINLLPFSTPAYYLNMYSGPTSALTKQFQANLVGLGAGDFLPPKETKGIYLETDNAAQFVIAWISVQNKQGEEKGMMVIWPALLCLSLMSMPETANDSDNALLFAYNRKPLAYIPELPLALQASPVPAPATVPTQPRAVSPQDSLVSPSLFTPVGRRSFSRETTPSTAFPMRSGNQVKSERPPLTRATSSFSAEATQAFRTLAISQLPPNGMRDVAAGVGKFVDFMAKERERERERIKKEKEAATVAAQAPKGAGASHSLGPGPPDTSSSIVNPLQPSTLHDLASLAPGSSQIMPSITVNTHSLVNPSQIQMQHPPIPPIQPSYPSPPEEAVKVEQTSPFESNGTHGGYAADVPPNGTQQAQVNLPETLDSFDGMDKFMMDLGMDFSMTIPPSTGHQGVLTAETVKVDFDSLGVFTDDDFSFFDDPVCTSALSATLPEASALTSDEALKSLGIPPLLQDGLPSAVPDSTGCLMSFGNPSPWASTKSGEEFDIKEHEESSAPELLLTASPDGSNSSSFGPATPEIICISDAEALNSETQSFNPIRFSKQFHSADAKYAIGKFSSSLIEQDLFTREPPVTVLWRMNYSSLTDPRVDVIKKLIGVKRRIGMQGVRFGSPSPPFQDTRSEWESCADDDISVMDVDSERDSDEEYQNFDNNGIDSVSRPSTPLASHLPLGPTLLSTQFLHSILLPLSVNLRASGASFAGLDMASPIPNPVPTPVSPAAVLGLANEKSRSLETAVRALSSEVVENALWESAWRASSIGQAPTWRQDSHCEQVDATFDESYFLSAGWLWDKMSIDSFSSFASSESASDDVKSERNNVSLKALEQPMFTLGKAESLVQLSPAALRFWSKMGLSPRSGPKDVVTFILYEDDSRPFSEVENWLSRVSAIYSAKGYGTHSLGKSSVCSKDGFVPVHYKTFRKTLASLIDSIGTIASSLLIYVVTPSSILSLSSPFLRQIFSSINRVLSGREEDNICFHLVPDLLFSAEDDISATTKLETLVDNVYDRILRPIDRFMSRSLFAYGERTLKHFEAPSFTLARSPTATTSLSFHHPPLDLGSLDRHTLLHVGYRLTRCRKWLVAACIDQRGEGHDLGVWLASDENDPKQHVSHVWNFAMDFARRANVEWRIAIAKLGTVDEIELEAWNALLNDELSVDNRSVAMHVSVLCVDDESGWSVLAEESCASQRPPSSHDSHGRGQLLSSISSSFVLPSLRCPLSSNSDAELGAQQHVPDDDEDIPHSADRLRPLRSAALITVPSTPGSSPRAQFIHLLQAVAFPGSTLAKTTDETHEDICRNYHELAVLTQARWHLHVKYVLPYHLAALHIVDSTLELTEMVTE